MHSSPPAQAESRQVPSPVAFGKPAGAPSKTGNPLPGMAAAVETGYSHADPPRPRVSVTIPRRSRAPPEAPRPAPPGLTVTRRSRGRAPVARTIGRGGIPARHRRPRDRRTRPPPAPPCHSRPDPGWEPGGVEGPRSCHREAAPPPRVACRGVPAPLRKPEALIRSIDRDRIAGRPARTTATRRQPPNHRCFPGLLRPRKPPADRPMGVRRCCSGDFATIPSSSLGPPNATAGQQKLPRLPADRRRRTRCSEPTRPGVRSGDRV